MQKIRSRRFHITLRTVLGASVLFLLWLSLWGKKIAQTHFQSVSDCVLCVFALAAASFVAFCFLPYFRGDRRWFSISGLLTGVFFVGAMMLWNIPMI